MPSDPPVEAAFAGADLFLRLLTDDHPDEADRVEALLERAERGELALVTTAAAVAELATVLERSYGLARADVRDAVLALLNTPGLTAESEELLLQGAVWYAEKDVDFLSAYHAAWLRERGIAPAYTFDPEPLRRFDHLETRLPGPAGG